MIRHALKISASSEPAMKAKKPLHLEKRKRSRVSTRVPVSCVPVDSEGRPFGRNRGVVKNVSQTGLKLESEKDAGSDRLKLAFTDSDNNTAEITGKVVFSQKTTSGTYQIGVQLQGDRLDIIRFVSNLVRFHHYTKNTAGARTPPIPAGNRNQG
jgi:hypothetical protein